MFVLASLLAFVNQVSGTPYVSGGDTPNGTDCSGLASWVSNVATGHPAFGDRFHTANEESALLARGFQYGSEPGALVIGWNGGHTAVTLPDGTSVSSGEGGGVKIGGGGAFQRQFSHHMFLRVTQDDLDGESAPADVPVLVDAVNDGPAPVVEQAPAPAPEVAPAAPPLADGPSMDV